MSYTLHDQKVTALQQQLASWYASEEKIPVALSFGAHSSNSTRKKQYARSSHTLSLEHFDQVISIDTEACTVRAESRVTMCDLVQETLQLGLIPKIVPEFKGITVGGAINGAAAESSSHHWGIFSDACLSYEVLLGDGSRIEVSRNTQNDLFYALSGSYGSLGLVTAASIELVKAHPWVEITYHRYNTIQEATDALQQLYKRTSPPQFLDGIIFSKSHIVLMSGILRDHEEVKKLPKCSLCKRSSPWYFQHVKETKRVSEALPIVDYLFRYDQGAFWMGGYLLHIPLLHQFLRYIIAHKGTSRFTHEEAKKYSKVHAPSQFLRWLLYGCMSSQKLYRILHQGEEWVADHTIIQDFCIPEQYFAEFAEQAIDTCQIFPLWICPIKASHERQIFSPHAARYASPSTEWYINLGIYGIPPLTLPTSVLTHHLEKAVSALHGRKVLYSHSYYTPEEFWKIYSEKEYQALRTKYHASGVWKEIVEKLL